MAEINGFVVAWTLQPVQLLINVPHWKLVSDRETVDMMKIYGDSELCRSWFVNR